MSESLIAALEHRNELRAELSGLDYRHNDAMEELEYIGERRIILNALLLQREFEIQKIRQAEREKLAF